MADAGGRKSKQGGRRAGAGRRPRADRKGFVAHVARPRHYAADPVHVTMRIAPGLPSLRSQRGLAAVHAAIRGATKHGAARITQFSAQSNHVHLVVEAADEKALSRGIQSFAVRLARAVNRLTARRGRVWRDRHHRRDLRTARAVRTALVYVLMNVRKHNARWALERVNGFPEIDRFSSAPWFAGFAARAGPALETARRRLAAWSLDESPTAPSKTWLAKTGWRHAGGPIALEATPRSAG
jgi:hypothetical protein